MSTTRGVLYIHSAPSALCPHIEWAVGGVFGMPVGVTWTAQPIERAAYRCEYLWSGPVGTAARLASHGDGIHAVPLDTVILTMRQTGADMKKKYKETSRGGLAVNVIEC